MNRHPHCSGPDTCQRVAKITRRHDEVGFGTVFSPVPKTGGGMVDHLRKQTTHVDAIGSTQPMTSDHIRVGKCALQQCLALIK